MRISGFLLSEATPTLLFVGTGPVPYIRANLLGKAADIGHGLYALGALGRVRGDEQGR